MPEHIINEHRSALDTKRIVRAATEEDHKTQQDIAEREKKAAEVYAAKVAEHHLDMKLVSCEIMFDNSKIVFYFTSEHRVDFRMLVKDLASAFKMRIELRQIGVRDEACMIGGLGICGRPLCCGTFLDGFASVSIKMAKSQNLSLNPTKISGVCGRLMCCLKYEQNQYEAVLRALPRIGKEIDTPDGRGTVIAHNVLKETISVRLSQGEDSEVKQFGLESLGIEPVKVPLEDSPSPKHKEEKTFARSVRRDDEAKSARRIEEDEEYIPEEDFGEPIGVFSNRSDNIADFLGGADYDKLLEEEQNTDMLAYEEDIMSASYVMSGFPEDADEPHFKRIQKKNRKPIRPVKHEHKKTQDTNTQKPSIGQTPRPVERAAGQTVNGGAVKPRTEPTLSQRSDNSGPASAQTPNQMQDVKAPDIKAHDTKGKEDKAHAAPAVTPVKTVPVQTAKAAPDNKASSWQEALKRAMTEAKK